MSQPLDNLFATTVERADADLDERERFLDQLTSARAGRSFVFATCHRVEAYSLEGPITPRPAAAHVWQGTDAARHLFRVAAGLTSLIPGERQVLGQLRRLRDSVRAEPLFEALIERALRVGRDVRADTGLGMNARSLGSLAVDEALHFLERPEEATAFVVGAGEMGKLASRALRHRVRTLFVANRDGSRATELAQQIGAEAVSLAAVDGALGRADCVISAADTRGTLFSSERLRRRIADRSLVLVDLAVPRSVAADARQLPGLVYRTADDLTDRCATPAAAVLAAERACEHAAQRFATEWQGREAVPVIRALRARSEEQQRRHLARALARLGHLDARDREVVRALASSLTNALLHEPTVALRASPERSEAARALFGLDKPT
jgi:glutamyl-tRNA reductase